MSSRLWRNCRLCLRWCRIGLLFLILAAASVLLWFNQIGLPPFLKNPLLANLRQRGIQVEFSRMRLRMTRGIVAENVRVGATKNPDSPTLAVREAQLLLDFGGLLRGQVQIQGVVLHEGRLVIPINATNQPADTLELTNIQTDLRFHDNDIWSLDNFTADFKNTKIALSGDVAHAAEIRQWELFNGPKTPGPNRGRRQLQKISETLGKIHLNGTPHLTLTLQGDGRDPHSFDIRLQVTAPSAQTPWFNARDLQFAANLTAPPLTRTNPGLAGFWTNIEPYRLTWSARFAHLRSPKLNADSGAASGSWRAPDLAITNLDLRLGGGALQASLRFDAASQWLYFTNDSAFDLHAVEPLLTQKMHERLDLFAWTEPPVLHASGAVDLATMDFSTAKLPAEGQVQIYLQGDLAFTNATVGGVAVDEVRSPFTYANRLWHLPALEIVREKTRLRLDASEDEITKNYRSQIQGRFDLDLIRPWLKSKSAQREVGRLAFTQPLALNVLVRGSLNDASVLAVDGRLAITNLTVRGGNLETLTTGIRYTNRVVEFIQPAAWRAAGTQTITADEIRVDLNEYKIYFTNGYSTAEPQVVANAIGPKTGHTLEPYQFLTPPAARVNGYVSLRSSEDKQEMEPEDLQVDVLQGAPFRWLKFSSKNVTGSVRWLGGTLLLTNLNAEFYGGNAQGRAAFDFQPKAGTDFNFAFNLTNANLHWLIAGLASPTNQLEGLVGGRLVVTSGNSTNWQLMNGYGHASLHNGLIWSAPIFGILSSAVNTLAPGLGSSRATDAAGTFTMTNGVIYSDDLEIHSTMMRLKYTGTVDLKENLNARATALPLRDNLGGVGEIISTALWPMSKLFEYKVTGTLAEPKMEPFHDLGKLILAPLHPFKTLENILPAANNTNTPAGK